LHLSETNYSAVTNHWHRMEFNDERLPAFVTTIIKEGGGGGAGGPSEFYILVAKIPAARRRL
jgi:hypothetical protein